MDLPLNYLFPSNLDYVGYTGSLTTPPCSEGVMWHLFLQSVDNLSAAQVRGCGERGSQHASSRGRGGY